MLNSIVRSALRVSTVRSLTQLGRTRDFTRTFWHMSKPEGLSGVSVLSLQKPSIGCSCGCGSQNIHTKGERELVEFLAEEIEVEKKVHKGSNIPTEVDGFKVTFKGAEVEMTKKTDKETIKVSFNINHTVDSDGDPNLEEEYDDKEGLDEMKSKPNFEVDIIKGGKTLSFTCSFLNQRVNDGEYNDVFGIDEVTIFEGEWTDNCYSVSGGVLDGYLYDLLMNLLEEKGISNEFGNKLGSLSTVYEHATYIGLLESLSKFTSDGK